MSKLWDAIGYSQHSTPQYINGYRFLFDIHGNNFGDGKEVLDIGCGVGKLTKEIANRVTGHVVGIDYSEDMIKLAQQQNAAKNLSYQVMDAQRIDFPNRKFDIVVSTYCIHWVADKAAVFLNIKRHIKEKGVVLLTMPLPHQELLEIRAQLMSKPIWNKHFRNHQNLHAPVFDCEYDKYAKNAGLNNIIFSKEQITTKFENRAELQGFLRNISPFLSYLKSTELKNKFMSEYTHIYLSNPLHSVRADGSCDITFTYAMLTAQH